MTPRLAVAGGENLSTAGNRTPCLQERGAREMSRIHCDWPSLLLSHCLRGWCSRSARVLQCNIYTNIHQASRLRDVSVFCAVAHRRGTFPCQVWILAHFHANALAAQGADEHLHGSFQHCRGESRDSSSEFQGSEMIRARKRGTLLSRPAALGPARHGAGFSTLTVKSITTVRVRCRHA